MFEHSYIAYLLPVEASGKPSKKDFISLPTFPALSWVKTACGPTLILTRFQFWSQSEIALISKFKKTIGKSTQLEKSQVLDINIGVLHFVQNGLNDQSEQKKNESSGLEVVSLGFTMIPLINLGGSFRSLSLSLAKFTYSS